MPSDPLTEEEARKIAWLVGGGHFGPLHVFACSGEVADRDAILAEIVIETLGARGIVRQELQQLYQFSQTH